MSYSNILSPKLRVAFAHRAKDGPQEVHILSDPLLISDLIFFRLIYFPGWLARHWKWSVKVDWDTHSTRWLRTASHIHIVPQPSYFRMFISWNNGLYIRFLADNPYKANFVQDDVQSNLFADHGLENWDAQVPTIYHEYSAVEESPQNARYRGCT